MKILVVGPSWVGDAVMAQSLYKLILQETKNKIDVLAPQWTLGVLDRMKEVETSICSPFDHGEFKFCKRVEFGRSMESRSYDQAIILTNSLKSALIPYFSKIPKRTGWLGEMRYGLINDIRKFDRTKDTLMIEKFAVLADDISDKNIKIPWPSLSINPDNLLRLSNNFSFDIERKTLSICPGAEFGPSKRWPTHYFAEVVLNYLSKDWQVFILGSSKDVKISSEIKEKVPAQYHQNLFNFTGSTKIVDAIDILSNSNLVLTNDSGLMHIAAAVDSKLLALYGPTSPEFTPPLSKKAKIIKKVSGMDKTRRGSVAGGYHPGLLMIKPDEVMENLDSLEKTSSL